MEYSVPFNRPSFTHNELRYIQEAIVNGKISGDGIFTKRCQELLKTILGAPSALLTTSCTHALEMTALLLNISSNDDVVVPSFSFSSTANAFVLRGARPIFSDIKKDTLNLDDSHLKDILTPNTKAVVVVHYAGVACEMDSINQVCRERNIAVIEDNAHGFMGTYKGYPLGSLGTMSTLSFHETKNFTCGEGGAIVLMDAALSKRAEILREKGTNRSSFFRGEVDKYTWLDIGSSFLPSEILAAALCAQLEQRDRIQAKRRRIWERYNAGLKDWASYNGVCLPVVPTHCDQSFHMFYMIMPSLDTRTRLIDALKSHGFLAVFHYLPLHLSPMGRAFGGVIGQCPVCEDMADRIVRLPLFNELRKTDQEAIIAVINDFQ